MFFALEPGSDPSQALRSLRGLADGDQIVAGLGQSLVVVLGCNIQGLRIFPHDPGSGFDIPSTPAALWLWLRGDDRGQLMHLSRLAERTASPAFRLTQVIDAFRHGAGLDLTGYEDGTENPKDEAAIEALAQLKRMEGIEDGISDALFKFTRPVSGSYFWCPPLKNERLDLSALSL